VPELPAVGLVTITQEIGRRGLIRKGVHDLLGGPVGGGVLDDVEVDDPPAVVGEHDEDEEDAEASGRHGEEIDRDQVANMVGKEGPPRLRWPRPSLRHQAGGGALGDVDAELQEFPVDARSTPQGIRRGHVPDESGDLDIDRWATAGGPRREVGPVLAKASALPS
jgi:hypothetical protein